MCLVYCVTYVPGEYRVWGRHLRLPGPPVFRPSHEVGPTDVVVYRSRRAVSSLRPAVARTSHSVGRRSVDLFQLRQVLVSLAPNIVEFAVGVFRSSSIS